MYLVYSVACWVFEQLITINIHIYIQAIIVKLGLDITLCLLVLLFKTSDLG